MGPISARSLPRAEVMFGGRRWLCCRIRSLQTQAFAEDPASMASSEVVTCANDAVSNEKRMNLSPLFECGPARTRHQPGYGIPDDRRNAAGIPILRPAWPTHYGARF